MNSRSVTCQMHASCRMETTKALVGALCIYFQSEYRSNLSIDFVAVEKYYMFPMNKSKDLNWPFTKHLLL